LRIPTGVTAGLVGALLVAGVVFASPSDSGVNVWPYATTGRTPVLVAAGDIACQPPYTPDPTDCQSEATANQIEAIQPDLVAVLGDEQYQAGAQPQFEGSFDTTWGAFKFLQRPAPGNHESYVEHGQPAQEGTGYFEYYNGYTRNADGSTTPRPSGQAGTTGQGWYSYNLGDWHLISLNAECPADPAGADCVPNSTFFQQETAWLSQDLASDHAQCTIAYWHQPLFTAVDPAPSSQGAETKAWWNLLYHHGADVVLNGHDHVYARWAQMNPSGQVDTHNGIRQFEVGTGGEDHDTLASPLPSAVQAATDTEFGVLKLDLGQGKYSWNFLPARVTGQANTFTDSGTGTCHGPSQAG
jgi:hypothetical protein